MQTKPVAQHTPTPWYEWNLGIGDNGQGPFTYPLGTDPDIATANAAFIVRSVNAHDDLVAAAKDALESLLRLPNVDAAYRVTCIGQLETAIAKAEGGAS
jgi:hypothetical protein